MVKRTLSVRRKEITIGYALKEFYKQNSIKGLSIETQKSYKTMVGNFVSFIGETRAINSITEEDLENYLSFKLETVKMSSAVSYMKNVRVFLSFCGRRKFLTKELDVLVPKCEIEQKEPYTDEELRKILAKPISNNWVEWRNWATVNYLVGTGQRLSTVLNIKVSHIDLINQRVWLEHNKDRRKKWMPLSTATTFILREYIEHNKLHSDDYLFPTNDRRQQKNRGLETTIERYNRSRGVNKSSIHLFRHTFAKNYILAGGNAVKLQKLLNHKKIDTTMKYVNLYTEDLAEGLDALNPLDNFYN